MTGGGEEGGGWGAVAPLHNYWGGLASLLQALHLDWEGLVVHVHG